MTPDERLGHYQINGKLGEGGMGAVYRATDLTLGREVALKVLPAAVAGDAERLDRFQREARAVAALNHPNIVTIYSVEHVSGVHFLTMELVTGRPLNQVLSDGPLPMSRVTAISSAIAEALGAAHAKGIVHRDLKPANVVLTETGQVKVLDFGLAKMRTPASISAAGESATALATEVGAVLGTPAYMAPEQVSGLDVDHRADIFSLGILMYEMATGVRPFRGRTTAEIASSILRDEPALASTLRASIPPAIAGAIARCLDKNPATRTGSMADVAATLQPGVEAAPKDARPSVAVLPFQNLSADPANEFFGDGLAEDILNALAQVEGLRVAARTSSFSFKDRKADLAAIGDKLRVATVLDGSVRRAGNRVRVTVQLVDIETGSSRWSERYDREMADIFEVQDEIARAIADKLKVTLTTGPSSRLVRPGTASVDAYDLYVRGRALLLKRGRHVDEGTTCLHRAVELDPAFAAAWAGLADSYTVRGYWGAVPPGEMMPKALTAARRAVSLDPGLAEAHAALAMALLLWERDFDGSRASFVRSLELNPNYVQGRCWYGQFQLQWVEGRMAEGVAEARRALDADPLSAFATTILGFCLFCAGETAEGLERTRRGAEMDPDSLLTHWIHGLAAWSAREFDEALAALRRAEAVSDSHPNVVGSLTMVHADMGRMADARATHARLLEMARRRHVGRTILSLSYGAVGEMDQAFELAQQACDEREPLLIAMARGFPLYRRVSDDPRFEVVLRRLRLR